MATNKFIPQVWSAKILEALDKELVYAELFNTDYDGEITEAGDTVHIAQVGDVSIKDYDCGTDIAAPDDVKVEDLTLEIDQSKYFNISVCDVNEAQSKISLLDTATQRAGYGFADVCDKYLGSLLATSGTVKTGLGAKDAPIAITAENAYETLVKMKTALDKANLPKQERKVVVPPEFEGFMLLDPRFVAVPADESQARLAEGTVYRAAGFEIRTSNNVPSEANGGSDGKTAVYSIVGSSPIQGTFAQQILKTEAYRPEKRFADAVKGLHVYGAKVLRPQAVAVATVAF
nr:MAG: coat protein [Bacteriophage sp.]